MNKHYFHAERHIERAIKKLEEQLEELKQAHNEMQLAVGALPHYEM